jgi:hypothetical protein
MIEQHVKGYKYIGDPVYDAHNRPPLPPNYLGAFGFVRHPVMLAHSLWCHRGRKRGNSRAYQWDWQKDVELERECGSPDYLQFFNNIIDRPGIVERYFQHWGNQYGSRMMYGEMEHLAEDLIDILKCFGEEFNAEPIRNAGKKRIGKNATQPTVPSEVVKKIVRETERSFCQAHGYTEVLPL